METIKVGSYDTQLKTPDGAWHQLDEYRWTKGIHPVEGYEAELAVLPAPEGKFYLVERTPRNTQ